MTHYHRSSHALSHQEQTCVPDHLEAHCRHSQRLRSGRPKEELVEREGEEAGEELKKDEGEGSGE